MSVRSDGADRHMLDLHPLQPSCWVQLATPSKAWAAGVLLVSLDAIALAGSVHSVLPCPSPFAAAASAAVASE